MNLGETLRKLIKDNINTTRPFFGYVIEQNEDKTWVIQPIDDQPVINNVQTFQTELDGNDPIIGSLVLCIFIDDYNSFITEIIEYDTWFVNAEKSSTLYSANDTVIAGKQLILLGLDKTVNEVKQIRSDNTVDEIIYLGSKQIQLDTREGEGINLISGDFVDATTKNSISLRAGFDTQNDGSEISNGNGQFEVISSNGVDITALRRVEITGNNISLNQILIDIVNTLVTISAAAGNPVPPLPNLPALVTSINTYNAP